MGGIEASKKVQTSCLACVRRILLDRSHQMVEDAAVPCLASWCCIGPGAAFREQETICRMRSTMETVGGHRMAALAARVIPSFGEPVDGANPGSDPVFDMPARLAPCIATRYLMRCLDHPRRHLVGGCRGYDARSDGPDMRPSWRHCTDVQRAPLLPGRV